MVLNWIKSKKEITKEKLEEAEKKGKVKIRKGKSSHDKAKALAKAKKDLDE